MPLDIKASLDVFSIWAENFQSKKPTTNPVTVLSDKV